MEAEEVEQVVAAAWNAVSKAGVAESTQPAAFDVAVRLLVNGNLRAVGGGGGGTQDASDDGGAADPAGSAGSTDHDTHADFAKIAKKLEVDPGEVTKVYRHDDDGNLTVDIAMSKLPSGITQGARELVLLVAAGRQAALSESDTEVSKVVPTLEEHKKYDPKNFKSFHIKNEKDNWKVTRGGDGVRVTGEGIKAAALLIKKYAGTSA